MPECEYLFNQPQQSTWNGITIESPKKKRMMNSQVDTIAERADDNGDGKTTIEHEDGLVVDTSSTRCCGNSSDRCYLLYSSGS